MKDCYLSWPLPWQVRHQRWSYFDCCWPWPDRHGTDVGAILTAVDLDLTGVAPMLELFWLLLTLTWQARHQRWSYFDCCWPWPDRHGTNVGAILTAVDLVLTGAAPTVELFWLLLTLTWQVRHQPWSYFDCCWPWPDRRGTNRGAILTAVDLDLTGVAPTLELFWLLLTLTWQVQHQPWSYFDCCWPWPDRCGTNGGAILTAVDLDLTGAAPTVKLFWLLLTLTWQVRHQWWSYFDFCWPWPDRCGTNVGAILTSVDFDLTGAAPTVELFWLLLTLTWQVRHQWWSYFDIIFFYSRWYDANIDWNGVFPYIWRWNE